MLDEKPVWMCGGIVTDVEERITKKGRPFGKVHLEDFDNDAEIAFFDNWPKIRNFFIKDAVICMEVKLEKNPHVPDRVDLRVLSVNPIEEVQREKMQNFTVRVPADLFDEHFNKVLVKGIKGNRGPTRLKVQAIEPQTKTPLNLTVRHGITLTYDFVEAIEQFDGVRTSFE